MKKVFILFSFLILAITINTTKAQDITVDLVVFEPLPVIDFAAFAVANNLSGAPRIIQISILPQGQIVTVEGSIDWKRPESGQYENLFSFESYPFTSRTIFNDDIGNTDIKIKSSSSNKSAAEDNIKKGKPTGSYRLSIVVRDANGRTVSDQAELNFLNPAQTLTIRTPEPGSSQNIGGVLAEWDDVQGVTNYSIRANNRTNINQSLEEALKSGNPIINDKNVGAVTSVNLRELLDREWLPGQEIVFQVTANISGPGGGTKLYSNIVNFTFDMGSTGNQELSDGLINLFQGLGDEASEILSLLQNGEINLEDVTITFGDGQVMSLPEFQNLMIYLESNPDAIISVKYNQK